MAETDPQPDVRYLPVPTDRAPAAPPARSIAAARDALPPAAATAAGGFLAGVATFVLARVLRRRQTQRALARAVTRRRRGDGVDIAGTRSFLVDIHLLRR